MLAHAHEVDTRPSLSIIEGLETRLVLHTRTHLRRPLPYRAIDRTGMVKIVQIVCAYNKYAGYYTWLLDLRKAWESNIAIEWLLRKNFKQNYVDTESESQKSGLRLFFYILNSACPCKNYGLKCTPELKTLFATGTFFYHKARDPALSLGI